MSDEQINGKLPTDKPAVQELPPVEEGQPWLLVRFASPNSAQFDVLESPGIGAMQRAAVAMLLDEQGRTMLRGFFAAAAQREAERQQIVRPTLWGI
jgi:hypothetical protein